MTLYFIGAGPGDPELLTIKAKKIITRCPVCLYAGSLIPKSVTDFAPPDAEVIDTAPMTLDDIMAVIEAAHNEGKDIARLHSGDPSLYGAIAEQIRRLKALAIDYRIIPGVPAYAAAAAELGIELTIPEVAQSLVLTRTAMKASAMPKGEALENFARTGTTLAIHLSIRNLREIESVLTPYYGEHCPVVVAYRVGWEDQQFIYATLATMRQQVRKAKITRTALIFIGPALSAIEGGNFKDSALYDKTHAHILRPQRGNRGGKIG